MDMNVEAITCNIRCHISNSFDFIEVQGNLTQVSVQTEHPERTYHTPVGQRGATSCHHFTFFISTLANLSYVPSIIRTDNSTVVRSVVLGHTFACASMDVSLEMPTNVGRPWPPDAYVASKPHKFWTQAIGDNSLGKHSATVL